MTLDDLRLAIEDASVHEVNGAYCIVCSNKENAEAIYEAAWKYWDLNS